MPIRIFFEALMALQPKETEVDIHFTLGDLLGYLNPNAKYHRKNHLPYVIQGLNALYSLRIPYRPNPNKSTTEVDWIPVLPRTVPNLQSDDNAPIILEVKIPPDTKQGMLAEKDLLRKFGKHSSARFNAYLSACWVFDKYGTLHGSIIDPTKPTARKDDSGYLINADGKRIYNQKGIPIKNPYHKNTIATLDREANKARKKYPILSFDDLTRACFPKGFPTSKRATYQKRAMQAWDTLAFEEQVRIEKHNYGWRIMPSKAHINYYRAFKKSMY